MKRFGEYEVFNVTAIALCDEENEANRQNALLVRSVEDSGEVVEYVLFGWDMPEDEKTFREICEDASAWESLSNGHHVNITNPVTRTWRVYGQSGHRQRESFHTSRHWDFSDEENIRIIDVQNADQTGTNEYSIVRITCNTAEECKAELDGQLSDGLFEDSRYGEVEEI